MKRRFLNRLRYPYLQSSLPENILPDKGLIGKGEKKPYKPNPRSPRKGLQASRGLLLGTRRGRLEIYTKMMSGGGTAAPGGRDAPSLQLDTLERGPMLSIVAQTPGRQCRPGVWASKNQKPTRLKDKEMWSAQFGEQSPSLHQQLREKIPQSGALITRRSFRGLRAKGRFYQSISQLEGGISKRQEKRVSQVSLRMSERRKLRILYGGLSNREVDKLIRKGLKERGRFSDNLFKLLESRLDVVLWRIGFFPTIPAAQNWVCRGRVSVNNKALTIANYLLQPGDVVSILPQFLNLLRQSMSRKLESSSGIGASHSSHQGGLRSRFPDGLFDRWKEVRALPSFHGTIGAPHLPSGGGARSWRTGRRDRANWLAVRPSHVETSYLAFVAIYLYPSQRIFLPAPIDMETIQRR